MAKHHVYVFDKDATDVTTTGLVGDLKPILATFREEKNGISEVTLRIPYEQLEKWKACKVGNIIKCEVPVRVPPVIENDQYANTVQVGEENA
jgi:hypothetical protein